MAYKTGEPNVKTLNNVVIQLRNDTMANWNNSTYTLAAGELALAIDSESRSSVIRVGDGVHKFSELENAGSVITVADTYTTTYGGKDRTHGAIKVNGRNIQTFELEVADTTTIGAVLSQAVEASGDHAGYANISGTYTPGYVTVDANGKMTVQVVAAAEKLYTARTITVEDGANAADRSDVTGTFDFDGSADVSFNLQLKDQANVTIADGSTTTRATVVNVNKQGLVVGTDVIVTADVTDAVSVSGGSADAAKAIKTNASGLLDDTFLKASGVTANDDVSDAAYVAVKTDVKGRVVEGTTADNFIASKDNLGLVKSHDTTVQNYDKTNKVVVDNTGLMTVDKVDEAIKLTNARTFSINDGKNYADDSVDITAAAVSFDGTSNVSLTAALTTTGVTAGDYTRVTVDAKGRVTTGANDLVTTDITDAVSVSGGSSDAGKAIKTNATGELDDTFLKKTLAASDAANLGTFNAKAGSYNVANVTVDEEGRVTNISAANVTTAGGTSTQSGYLVALNASGKLDDSLIPNLAIGQVYTTGDYGDLTDTTKKAAFISDNSIQAGDVAIVTTDVSEVTESDKTTAGFSGTLADYKASLQANDGTYFYVDNGNSGNGTFVLIKSPGTAVQTVNGHYGPTVTLITDDIAEDGTAVTDLVAGSAADSVHNRYFTQARVAAYLDSMSVRTRFNDGSHIVLDNDTIVINAGDASGATTGA